MKKYLMTLVMILSIFTSCDKEKTKTKEYSTLINTSWEGYNDSDRKYIIEFISHDSVWVRLPYQTTQEKRIWGYKYYSKEKRGTILMPSYKPFRIVNKKLDYNNEVLLKQIQ